MLSALRDATYRRLLSAHIVALLGTGLATIAIGLIAVDIAGADAAGALGTILGIKMVTYLLLAPWAPTIARRLGAKRLMISADAIRALAALALPFVGDLATAYALVFVLQATSAFFTPTYQATLPLVLTREREYTGALALSRLAYDLEALASPTLAALLLTVAPASALFVGTGAGFLGSAALIASVALPRVRTAAPPSIRHEVTQGARLILRTPALRAGQLLQLTVAAGGSVCLVLTIPLVRTVLDGTEAEAAGLMAAFGLGSIVAAALMPVLLPRLGLRNFLLSGAMTLTLPLALVPVVLGAGFDRTGALLALGVVWFVVGMGYSATIAPMGRLVRENTRDDDLPAVFAGQFSLSHAWWIIAYPLTGWGATAIGFGATSVTMSAIALGSLIAAASIWKRAERTPAAEWTRAEGADGDERE